MDGAPRLFSQSSVCPSCPLRGNCPAVMTDHACVELRKVTGGPGVSHPERPGSLEELAALGGPSYEDVVPLPVPELRAHSYIPQPRAERAFRGYLPEDLYILRARDVLRRDGVLSATKLRELLDLGPDVRLVLVLFDEDEILERIWERGLRLVGQLAQAGYEAITAPSFSTYTPRPHTEFMINMKRSLLYFRLLQTAGARAIPRLAWIVSGNARDLGSWAKAHPEAETFALDLSTYRGEKDWHSQLKGLEIFDAITDGRSFYLINGPTVEPRYEQLFEVVEPRRLAITNATSQLNVAPRAVRSTGNQVGVRFPAKVRGARDKIERAARRAETSRERRAA
jgi:hypothetical protein